MTDRDSGRGVASLALAGLLLLAGYFLVAPDPTGVLPLVQLFVVGALVADAERSESVDALLLAAGALTAVAVVGGVAVAVTGSGASSALPGVGPPAATVLATAVVSATYRTARWRGVALEEFPSLG